jgi:hypothetical protein
MDSATERWAVHWNCNGMFHCAMQVSHGRTDENHDNLMIHYLVDISGY